MVRYYMWCSARVNSGPFTPQYIYIRELFFFIDQSNVAIYADDNSVYAVADNIELVIKQLESESKLLLLRLANNASKANSDTSYLIPDSRNNDLFALIDNCIIFNIAKMQKSHRLPAF